MENNPVAEVVWMVRGAWMTMALRAGCRLGVFDRLVEPDTPAGLAEATACDEGAMARFMTALATLGLLEERSDGTYIVTELGSTLTETHPSGVRSLALMQS